MAAPGGRPASPAAVCGAVCAALACGGAEGGPDGGRVSVADSAGVRIVTSSGARWAPGEAWSVAETPRVTIGRLDGPEEYQLFVVTGARVLSDGRIAVANAGSHQVRFYDRRGEFASAAGGQGEGPGEFRGIRRMDVSAGDSLFVWDLPNRRLTVLAPDGRFVRDLRLEPPGERAFPNYVGRFADGSLLATIAQVIMQPPEDGSTLRRTNWLVRFSAEGLPRDTVAAAMTRGSFVKVSPGMDAIAIYTVPYDPGTLSQIAGTELHVTHGEAAEVRTYAAEGTLRRIARLPIPPRPVTGEVRAAAIAEALANYDEGDALRAAREAYDAMVFPTFLAAFDALVLDDTDHLWARRHVLPGETRASWSVLSPEGAYLGDVSLPADFELHHIGVDFIVAGTEDELGVERLLMLDLARPAGSDDDALPQ